VKVKSEVQQNSEVSDTLGGSYCISANNDDDINKDDDDDDDNYKFSNNINNNNNSVNTFVLFNLRE
jgi:hypothetical protein